MNHLPDFRHYYYAPRHRFFPFCSFSSFYYFHWVYHFCPFYSFRYFFPSLYFFPSYLARSFYCCYFLIQFIVVISTFVIKLICTMLQPLDGKCAFPFSFHGSRAEYFHAPPVLVVLLPSCSPFLLPQGIARVQYLWMHVSEEDKKQQEVVHGSKDTRRDETTRENTSFEKGRRTKGKR